ncbi:hypothetical protein [Teichococcus aestuarii]
MLGVALLAEWITPYSITALDLRSRLAPPVFMGGTGCTRWARTSWGGTC